MGYRKKVVAELIESAQQHDNLARRKGWKADAETDTAMADHQRIRAGASATEKDLFDRIYS